MKSVIVVPDEPRGCWPERTVHVSAVVATTRARFGDFGEIEDVHVEGDQAFVTFVHRRSAEAAAAAGVVGRAEVRSFPDFVRRQRVKQLGDAAAEYDAERPAGSFSRTVHGPVSTADSAPDF